MTDMILHKPCRLYLLGLGVDKLHSLPVHGKYEDVGIGPEPLVVHVEEGGTI